MAQVVFYEKPGCAGNARQRALLEASGHVVERRDILTAGWTAKSLRPFFAEGPVRDWFNPAAPEVKSGAVDPDALTPDAALALMAARPLLIRRPLLEALGRRAAGFDRARIAAWIGLAPDGPQTGDACARILPGACAP